MKASPMRTSSLYAMITEMDTLLGVTAKDPQLLWAVLLALFGAALLIFLDRFSPDRA